MHIKTIPLRDREDYLNDLPTMLSASFIPLILVLIFYYLITSIWKKFFKSYLYRITLCVLLGAISIMLPLQLTYGFTFGDDVWLGIVVLASAPIPYVENRMFSLMQKKKQ
jgi:hypothetical protein